MSSERSKIPNSSSTRLLEKARLLRSSVTAEREDGVVLEQISNNLSHLGHDLSTCDAAIEDVTFQIEKLHHLVTTCKSPEQLAVRQIVHQLSKYNEDKLRAGEMGIELLDARVQNNISELSDRRSWQDFVQQDAYIQSLSQDYCQQRLALCDQIREVHGETRAAMEELLRSERLGKTISSRRISVPCSTSQLTTLLARRERERETLRGTNMAVREKYARCRELLLLGRVEEMRGLLSDRASVEHQVPRDEGLSYTGLLTKLHHLRTENKELRAGYALEVKQVDGLNEVVHAKTRELDENLQEAAEFAHGVAEHVASVAESGAPGAAEELLITCCEQRVTLRDLRSRDGEGQIAARAGVDRLTGRRLALEALARDLREPEDPAPPRLYREIERMAKSRLQDLVEDHH